MKQQYFNCNCQPKTTCCSIPDCPRKIPKITKYPQPNENNTQTKWREYYQKNWETQAYTCQNERQNDIST